MNRSPLTSSNAVISACGHYRYALERVWDEGLLLLAFVMLNPSTAGIMIDDATIRFCMGRARLMGLGGILVLNLFAYRATEPADLLRVADPIGPDNDNVIDRKLDEWKPLMVIAGWGAHGGHLGRAAAVRQRLSEAGIALYHLGLTKDGHPRHPLYVGYDVVPEMWR